MLLKKFLDNGTKKVMVLKNFLNDATKKVP